MEATVEIRQSDLAALFDHAAETDPHTRHAIRQYTRQHVPMLLWAVPIALAPSGAVALAGRVRQPDLWAALVLGVGLAVLVIYRTAAPHLCRARYLRSLLESVRAGLADYLGRQRITLGPDAIRWDKDWCNAAYSWAAVIRITSTQSHDFIFVRGQRVIIVPARCFADPADRDRFVESARKFYDAAATPAARARQFLENHDFPCPNCAYNLRGAPGQTCPECGQAIDLSVGTAPPQDR